MSLPSRKIITLLTTILISACVSNHNLRDGESSFDGGYQVSKVTDGIYYIYARTNGGPSENHEAAKEMFITQAVNSCASKNIRLAKTSSQLDYSKFAPLVVTELMGFAICADRGLSDQQIKEAITKYENE
ncbi:MAG: hypothetical protein ABW096_14435 [Candidatus Thiodiazotropha sp.]